MSFFSWNKELFLTFSSHIHIETLCEATGLALIPPGQVHHAPSLLLAHIFQVSGDDTNQIR